MNAEERLEKIRKHLERAYGHDNFSLREKENKEDLVKVEASIHFTDKVRTMEFKFGGDNITQVKQLSTGDKNGK